MTPEHEHERLPHNNHRNPSHGGARRKRPQSHGYIWLFLMGGLGVFLGEGFLSLKATLPHPRLQEANQAMKMRASVPSAMGLPSPAQHTW